ncbi:complex I subunit 1/NuoH family protein [Thermofilum pendens]|uniref:Respiratory-chain NADH dehydrogenase, subunit 1 n=1 Tax=Thermofilum pendens (strain DSM 2475 / Hrk 5) TaxID=368408 RepID=A1RZ42_THEPD|nr:complex I subunit 1 family protein [Thermofilum pendens]ABL78472.1 respiratory-chain NADH dehydrogenase, subunit 1 [Thermofilum pendens Hrk 5]
MLDIVLGVLVFPGLLFTVAMGFWFEYLERKVTARIQRRVGPLYAGPHGLLQPVYDFFKLLLKEEIVPGWTDVFTFRVAPILAVTIPVFGMCVLPVASTKGLLSFEGDFALVFLLLALGVLTLSLTGYSVLSPYTAIGVGRLLVQYSMYEGVFLLSLASAALQAKTMSFEGILAYQESHGFLGLYQPVSLAAALVALLAKLEKRPFDLPHAKQEVVAGWMTELSGRGLAFMRLYEDLSMVWGIALIVVVFLGGPLGPGYKELGALAGFAWFALKSLIVALAVILVSATTSRVRVYGLAEVFWKRVYPLVLLQLVVAFLLGWWA